MAVAAGPLFIDMRKTNKTPPFLHRQPNQVHVLCFPRTSNHLTARVRPRVRSQINETPILQ